MVTILHRELERKVEKVKYMKLEVMPPKTKNNINFQPEQTITDQSTLIVNFFVKNRIGGGGGGGIIEGGLTNFPPLKRGGLLERGHLLERGLNRGFTVCQLSFSLPLQCIQKTLNTSAPSTTLIPNVVTGKTPSNTVREETMMVWSPCKPMGNGCILKTLQPTLHQTFHKSNREHLKKNDGSLA